MIPARPAALGLALRLALHRHGWPAAAGLGLLALALALGLWGAPALRAQTAALAAAAAAPVAAPSPAVAAGSDAAARVAALHARLPEAAFALEAVQHLHQSAATHGVVLAAGEYRLVREPGAGVQRYQITLPADAPYPALRRWLAEVLEAHPTIALDELTLARGDVAQPQVRARVRWSLYLRSAGPVPAAPVRAGDAAGAAAPDDARGARATPG
jgi:hypothetical protein